MPAVYFEVAWPDGDCQTYYSPSTVIHQTFQAGDEYPLDDFATRVNSALELASARVQAKYGFACSAAADEQLKINHKIVALREQGAAGAVTLLAFR
ncbi:MSMEG_0570 family nitrogen starvation response protein [Teredinibacter turnerae]|uniref:MSMEG_0570 family nitrogen starvation response protein n=1 Tax=Teredinibacter turnerae TaxID=2426 RepID=UPI000381A779|nr:MSMEG_0570 family nitrogen starvation response protein [Teredinibacter turnerae]